jgi:protease IV
MKQFFASLLGTLTGLVVFLILGVLLMVLGLVALSVGGEKAPSVMPGSVIVFKLDGINITDTPAAVDDPVLSALLRGDEPMRLSLRQVVGGLRAAARDERVAGVWLTGALSAEGYGSGFAALREVRAALAEVKAAGKPVNAYFDELATPELYLAAEADRIALNPFGLVAAPGMAAESPFFAGTLEKVGVGVQVTRSGKYKAAIEPFIRRDYSPENRAQLEALLSDLWTGVRGEIAAARGLSAQALQGLLDREGLITPQLALDAGLITHVAYRDEEIERLRELTDTPPGEPFTQIALVDYLRERGLLTPASLALPFGGMQRDTLAIVYAEGEIVDGEGGEDMIGGATFARHIRALREDQAVKAIVLRINSPGGSATASEHILRELQLAAAAKPVVVSMGSYAASGGYWIATAARRIYTEPSTVTGSIGVFGVQFNIEELSAKAGVSWDTVQTGEFANLFSVTQPKSERELAIFQRLVDWTYEQFLERVATARSMTRDQADALAQGRVWTGNQAVALKLADELGGLQTAIAYAAKEGGLPERGYRIDEFPGTRPLGEILENAFRTGESPETRLARSGGALGAVARQIETPMALLRSCNDPRGVYARLPLIIRAK